MTLYHCMWFACVLLLHLCVCVLQGVPGTGAGGRIVSRDVAAAGVAAPVTGPSTAGPYQTIELSNMRKVSTLV
jgi:pyruvate/2-oxoglutarate dehydrogenase complex dihydrolipoamide acyltransferase (E2) component